MSIVLFRVDERLIHGQVVVGWGTQLRPDLVVVVDDALADSQWEQELYTLGLPAEMETSFETVEAARRQLDGWRLSPKKVFLLARDISTMLRLAQNGRLRGEEINIGGLHHSNGRRQALPYVFLSDRELDELAELSALGAVVSARDLPSSRRIGYDELMRSIAGK
jgi:mannose/fructose/N-acetylgalactosamine-specific phosphotransferase system component IIB